MATIVEDMNADNSAGASSAMPPADAPIVLDDATLARLAAFMHAGGHQPARSAWQTSLLVTLAGALIAAATAGYFSLRGDIATLGTSLRTEIAAVEESLRTEIAAVDASLRAEIAAGDASLRTEIAAVEESLRTEMQTGFREVNAILLDHTDRLARLEAATG